MRTKKRCKCCGAHNAEHEPNDTVCRYCNWRIRRGLPLYTKYPIKSIYEMTKNAPGFAAFCAPRLVSQGKRFAMKKAKHGAAFRSAFAAFCKRKGLNSIVGYYTTGRGTSEEAETATLYRVSKDVFDSKLPDAPEPVSGAKEAA